MTDTMSPLLLLVVALRAVIELVFWLLLGRVVLALLAGRSAANNSVLRLFDLLLKPPRAVLGRGTSDWRLAIVLVLLWLLLGLCKGWLVK